MLGAHYLWHNRTRDLAIYLATPFLLHGVALLLAELYVRLALNDSEWDCRYALEQLSLRVGSAPICSWSGRGCWRCGHGWDMLDDETPHRTRQASHPLIPWRIHPHSDDVGAVELLVLY